MIGLTPVGLALQVELDDARQHPVVGDGERRHAQLGRPLDQVVDLAGAVEGRVVRVDVQVAEVRGRAFCGLGLVFHCNIGIG